MLGLPTLISKYLNLAKARGDILEEKVWVNITKNIFVRLENFFHVNIHKVVERINMLFHKAFDFEKSRQ